jgi:hypothetical protein
MKVSYVESLANCYGLHRRCGRGNDSVLSVRQGGKRRPAMELRNLNFRVPTRSLYGEGETAMLAKGKNIADTAESREPVHAWKSQSREPGDPIGCWWGNPLNQHGQRTVQRARLP